ncbi:noncompact myelin-associated protein [Esox lucius]|uniref:noncompact myelin-associated protein n=1 Tax=Esox lucius TaxID=8010 RepID=UPI000577757E|nr:noncompact myelin-associated protein [Esox lucius]XP_010877852.1 noncompact myelin-associated protein [Esox lucius]XP_010877853.2 noncompact myelin-associated protein [Esox lucius]
MTSTASPVTKFTTVSSNATTTTKSREQILTQSSGAMIALIVVAIIIVLTILLVILKTYNRRTHVSRVLGTVSKVPPRPKMASSSTIHTSMPLGNLQDGSASRSFAHSNIESGNGFRLPRAELNSLEENNLEQQSTVSDSTVVTIHDPPSIGNT